jgi:proteic killer suppression protein
MEIVFEKEYLRELFYEGKTSDKKHRFQPQIVKKYIRTIDLMRRVANVLALSEYGGLHYEHMHGDKKGVSSVRINDQYRIVFNEILQGEQTIAEIVSIAELSNHYQ